MTIKAYGAKAPSRGGGRCARASLRLERRKRLAAADQVTSLHSSAYRSYVRSSTCRTFARIHMCASVELGATWRKSRGGSATHIDTHNRSRLHSSLSSRKSVRHVRVPLPHSRWRGVISPPHTSTRTHFALLFPFLPWLFFFSSSLLLPLQLHTDLRWTLCVNNRR